MCRRTTQDTGLENAVMHLWLWKCPGQLLDNQLPSYTEHINKLSKLSSPTSTAQDFGYLVLDNQLGDMDQVFFIDSFLIELPDQLPIQ